VRERMGELVTWLAVGGAVGLYIGAEALKQGIDAWVAWRARRRRR
jgi:hypothetical protein